MTVWAGFLAPVHSFVRLLRHKAQWHRSTSLPVAVTGSLRTCTEFPLSLWRDSHIYIIFILHSIKHFFEPVNGFLPSLPTLCFSVPTFYAWTFLSVWWNLSHFSDSGHSNQSFYKRRNRRFFLFLLDKRNVHTYNTRCLLGGQIIRLKWWAG